MEKRLKGGIAQRRFAEIEKSHGAIEKHASKSHIPAMKSSVCSKVSAGDALVYNNCLNDLWTKSTLSGRKLQELAIAASHVGAQGGDVYAGAGSGGRNQKKCKQRYETQTPKEFCNA